MNKAKFHLPGLFEFYELYKLFLPIFYSDREYFYEWADIASIYGAPNDCIWSGGRFEVGDDNVDEVLALLQEYGISARLTFSNSMLREEHLLDKRCNSICLQFEKYGKEGSISNGVIVHSDLLADYIRETYPGLYLVSSTTKVLTRLEQLEEELTKEAFSYVVPDFRLNKQLDQLSDMSSSSKEKLEFLCNECCWVGCADRKECYENVSRQILGEDCPDFICKAPGGKDGYLFSRAMKSPAFIGVDDIRNIYLPAGFSNFKIEGRGLGSALILEFLLYYLVKPEFQLRIREKMYLDCMLDLF